MPPPAPAGERSGAPDQRRISANAPHLAAQRAVASSDKTVCSCERSSSVESHVCAACESASRQPVTPCRPRVQESRGEQSARSAAGSAPRTVLRQASRMEPIVEAHESAIAAAAKAKKSPEAPPPREAATGTLHRSASRTPRTSPFLLSDPVTSLEHLLPSSPAQSQPQRKPPPQRASSTRQRTASVQALPPGSALRDASIGCGGPGVLKLSESDSALRSSAPRRGISQSPTRVHGRMPPPKPLKMSAEPRRALQPRTNSGPLVSHKRVHYDDAIVDDEPEPAGPSKKAKVGLAAHEDVFGPAPPLRGARDQQVMRRNGTPQGSGSRPNVRVPSLEVLSEMRASSSHVAHQSQQQQPQQQQPQQQQPQDRQRAPSPAEHLPAAPVSKTSSSMIVVDDLFTPKVAAKLKADYGGDAPAGSSAPPSVPQDKPQQPAPAVASSSLPAAFESSEDVKAAKPPTSLAEDRKRELRPAAKSLSPDPGLYAPPSETAVLRRVMSHGVPPPAPPPAESEPEPSDLLQEPSRSPSPDPDEPGLTAAQRREIARLSACYDATRESARDVLYDYIVCLSSNLPGMPSAVRVLPTEEATHAARVSAFFLGGLQAVQTLHDCLRALAAGNLCLDDVEDLRFAVDV